MRHGMLVLALFGCTGDLTPSPFDDAAFERRVWLEHRGSLDPDNPRGPMFDDLQRRIVRPGMSRDEVLAMLGTPDFDPEWRHADRVWRYSLGVWSGMRADQDVLEVRFREEEVARLARVER